MKFKSCIYFFLLYSISFAYMNIYPLSFDQRIDNIGGIKDFTLTNTTNRAVKYQINILENKDTQDMTSWTEVYPRTLTLKPGAKGKIKMYTRAPKGTFLGEYSTVLNIKELGIPENKLLYNIEELGNTGSASTLLVFAQNYDKFKSGDLICISVFGGGYSAGSCLIRMN